MVYNRFEEHEKALADYNDAIRLDPEMAAAYYNRGWTYYELGQYDLALSDFSESIRLDPSLDRNYLWRARIYKMRGETEKAIADCRYVLENSNDSESHRLAEEILQELENK